jgi:CubicO group peptidase (beta-lactamase class C family)
MDRDAAVTPHPGPARRPRSPLPFMVILVVMVASSLAVPGTGSPPGGPPFDWPTARPEHHGMSPSALARLQDRLAASRTKALLVIRDDRIVHEWYADGHGATRTHYSASMAKALVGGLAVGVAVTDGRIALDHSAARYVARWRDDSRKSRITIRHLGSHTAGLEDAEVEGVAHGRLTGWKGEFWKRGRASTDPFTIARDLTPTRFDPGQRFQYSSPGIAMLSYAVTASLGGPPHPDLRTLLRDRVMRPIGVRDEEWSVGYGETYRVDGLPLVAAWGGGKYTARAVARVARLLLREGDWEGTQLLSREAVRQITTDAGTPGHGAIGWWSNAGGKYARLPRDAFWASGAGHQVVLVIPSLRLIAVRNGQTLSGHEEHHDALDAHLFQPLLDTLTAGRSPACCRHRTTRAPRPALGPRETLS